MVAILQIYILYKLIDRDYLNWFSETDARMEGFIIYLWTSSFILMATELGIYLFIFHKTILGR